MTKIKAKPWYAGEEPPLWFVDDGCSAGAPDKLFGVCLKKLCRLHDWAYHEARVLSCVVNGTWFPVKQWEAKGRLKIKAKRNNDGLKHLLLSPHLPERERALIQAEISRLKSKMEHIRTTGDINLRTNIRTLFRSVKKGGRGKVVASLYFIGVLKGGGGGIHHSGHPGNFTHLNAQAVEMREQILRRIRGEQEAA